MKLTVTCFYCGAKKEIQSGDVVKLSCDRCASPRVVLQKPARFRCVLCREVFDLPAGRQVMAYHDTDHCRGRGLILMDD